MIYVRTNDTTGRVYDWGGAPLAQPTPGGFTDAELPNADDSDQALLTLHDPLNCTVVGGRVSADGLAIAKGARRRAVDARSRERISEGFDFGGFKFSLSREAQTSLMVMDGLRDDALFVYPVSYGMTDDVDGTFSVAGSAEVHMMYMTAVGTVRWWLDTGNTLKAAINAAADATALAGVVDDR